MSQNKSREYKALVADMALDILRDHKRRILFYDEISKESYQVKVNQTRLIKFYQLRLVIAMLIYFLSTFFLPQYASGIRPLMAIGLGILTYLLLFYGFRLTYFKDKPIIKLPQDIFELRYQLDVLKQKKLLYIYEVCFVALYSALAIVDVNTVASHWLIKGFVYLFFFGLFLHVIRKVISINSQIKLSK